MSTDSIIKKGRLLGDDMKEKEMDPTGVTRIVKISINHSEWRSNRQICGLTVYFERNGTTQCTDHWGRSEGELTEVNLKTNEYITSVNGHVNFPGPIFYFSPLRDDNFDEIDICIVTSLVLKTNLNIYGPFGHERGEPFEFPAPPGGEIIGFHGYCRNDWVDALGVYVRQSNGTIIKKGPFLGRGGIVKHMDPTGITRIVKISIYHSDKIDALTMYFERNGITQCTDRWGGDGGNLTEINLKTNEYIKSVKGKYCRDSDSSRILKSLVLETNFAVYGPYGKEEGESFEHTSPPGGQIIGFFESIPKALISKSMPCGGSGGIARDMNLTFANYHIEKVSIRHGDTIDALSVCYTLEDGNTERTSLWGGETGELTEFCRSILNTGNTLSL